MSKTRKRHWLVDVAIQQIVKDIPEVRKLRIIDADGIVNQLYRYDAGCIKRNTETDIEEDKLPAISAATLSLGERISESLVLGDLAYTFIIGENHTHFLFMIGRSQEWCLSCILNGHPSIDNIIVYFKERDFLAEIVPLL